MTTWDVFDTNPNLSSFFQFSNGNLTVTTTTAFTGGSLGGGTSGLAQPREGKLKGAGKFYVEFTWVASSGNFDKVGLSCDWGVCQTAGCLGDFPTTLAFSLAGFSWNTTNDGFGKVQNGGSTVSYWDTPMVGDVLSLAIDLQNMLLWGRRNNNGWTGLNLGIGTGNPATATNGLSISGFLNVGRRVYPAVNLCGSGAVWTANFGQNPFVYSVPSGFTPGWPNTTSTTTFGSLLAGVSLAGGGFYNLPTGASTFVSKFTPSQTGVLNSIIVVPANFGLGGNVAVVYADSAGAPGALLGTASGGPSPGGAGEYVFTFSSGPTLTASTPYWFGLSGTNGGNAGVNLPQASSTNLYIKSGATPNPFGTPTSTAAQYFPLLINFTSSGGGSAGYSFGEII